MEEAHGSFRQLPHFGVTLLSLEAPHRGDGHVDPIQGSLDDVDLLVNVVSVEAGLRLRPPSPLVQAAQQIGHALVLTVQLDDGVDPGLVVGSTLR